MSTSNYNSRRHFLRIKKLISEVTRLGGENKFYRRKLSQAGILSPNDLKNPSDFLLLPFTLKSELVVDQQKNPYFGSNCNQTVDKYIYIETTSGSTRKRPLIIPTTRHDLQNTSGIKSKWLEKLIGVNDDDIILLLVPRGLFLSLFNEITLTTRAKVVAVNQEATEQIIQRIGNLGATVIFSSPTQLLILGYSAKRIGINPSKDFKVGKLLVSGEPGGGNKSVRRELKKLWGAEIFDLPGSSENGLIATECQKHTWPHLLADQFIYEIIDPVSDKPAKRGELVLTNLNRRDFPFIRYRTGDLVELDNSPCPCRNPNPRLKGGIIGRIDKRIRIGDLFFHQYEIENIINCTPNVLLFNLTLLPKFSAEIKTVLSDNGGQTDIRRMSQEFKTSTGITPRIIKVKLADLSFDEWKFKKILDKRFTDSGPLGTGVVKGLKKLLDRFGFQMG